MLPACCRKGVYGAADKRTDAVASFGWGGTCSGGHPLPSSEPHASMADQPEGVIMGGSAGHEAGLVENPVTLIDVIVPPVVLLALATGPYILLSRAKERRIGWATLVRILGPFSLTLLVFPLVMWIRSPIIDYFWGGKALQGGPLARALSAEMREMGCRGG